MTLVLRLRRDTYLYPSGMLMTQAGARGMLVSLDAGHISPKSRGAVCRSIPLTTTHLASTVRHPQPPHPLSSILRFPHHGHVDGTFECISLVMQSVRAHAFRSNCIVWSARIRAEYF